MTHVLDPLIEELGALVGALRRRDQNTLGGKTSTSERELYESAEESLRILRAEREGTKRGQHIADTVCSSCGVDLTIEHSDEPGNIMVTFHGSHRVGTRAAELRAEGRREERERVVAHLERMASTWEAHGNTEKARGYEDASLDIRHGEHWSGGEG